MNQNQAQEEEVTLINIAHGRAIELFDRTFQKVLENIQDMATEGETKRKITLEFTFEPNKDRSALITTVQAKASLAPITQVPTTIYTAAHKRNGRLLAVEYDPTQASLLRPQERPEPLRAVVSGTPPGPAVNVNTSTGEIAPSAQ